MELILATFKWTSGTFTSGQAVKMSQIEFLLLRENMDVRNSLQMNKQACAVFTRPVPDALGSSRSVSLDPPANGRLQRPGPF
jgi:hypothetical protein